MGVRLQVVLLCSVAVVCVHVSGWSLVAPLIGARQTITAKGKDPADGESRADISGRRRVTECARKKPTSLPKTISPTPFHTAPCGSPSSAPLHARERLSRAALRSSTSGHPLAEPTTNLGCLQSTRGRRALHYPFLGRALQPRPGVRKRTLSNQIELPAGCFTGLLT